MSDNRRAITRAWTHSLDWWPGCSCRWWTAQRADAKADPDEAGNGRRMQRWILNGTTPASSVLPPVQER